MHSHRQIMAAIAELTAEQGYEATKIEDIARRAGVGRGAFYDDFDGKEQAFLATFDAAVEEAIRRVEKGCADAGSWQERVRAGLASFLGYLAEEPALARMCMVEALSATPAATRRYEEAMQRFIALTGDVIPSDDRLPEAIEEMLVGGVAWIVRRKIRRWEAEQAEDLLPELSEFMLAPFASGA